MAERENFLACMNKEYKMQLSSKLILAATIALASSAAFAASNGDPDNDWLMKKAVPSGTTSGTTSSQAAPSAPAPQQKS